MTRRGGLGLLVAAAVLPFASAVAPAAENHGFRPIELIIKPIEDFMIGNPGAQFGSLEFRGGAQLLSKEGAFGGLSGIDFSPDGKTLYAVADFGQWFAADPIFANGRFAGMENARIAPMLNSAGEPLSGKRYGDAEGLRIVKRDGRETAYVSFEVANDVRRFIASPSFAEATSTAVALPAAVKTVRRTAGLEAIAVAPMEGPLDGAMVLVTERTLDQAGNLRGWIVGGPRSGAFSVKRTGNYDVTDAAFLPDGDLLVLERRLNFADGVGMRLRRIAGEDLRPGATVDGDVLLEAGMRYQIDNMEGLAVHTNAAGETIIAIVSDNNLNLIQRTLVLFFALVPDPAAAAATSERPRS